MSPDILLSLITLAIGAAWTPGPNNVLVAQSGARFGFHATFPHIAGIGLGFPFMIFCIGAGLGQIFQQSALLREGLRWFGAAVLLWIAWKMAMSSGAAKVAGSERPFTFLQGAAFQWINPKAWVMAISIAPQFVTEQAPIATSLIVGSVFVVVGFGSASTWAFFGAALQNWLRVGNRLRIFNICMALLIAFSVIAILFGDLA